LIEVKKANKIRVEDCRHLRNVNDIFDKPIIGSFLLSKDNNLQQFDENLFAVPAAWFLS
jgi:hypothetical protein